MILVAKKHSPQWVAHQLLLASTQLGLPITSGWKVWERAARADKHALHTCTHMEVVISFTVLTPSHVCIQDRNMHGIADDLAYRGHLLQKAVKNVTRKCFFYSHFPPSLFNKCGGPDDFQPSLCNILNITNHMSILYCKHRKLCWLKVFTRLTFFFFFYKGYASYVS